MSVQAVVVPLTPARRLYVPGIIEKGKNAAGLLGVDFHAVVESTRTPTLKALGFPPQRAGHELENPHEYSTPPKSVRTLLVRKLAPNADLTMEMVGQYEDATEWSPEIELVAAEAVLAGPTTATNPMSPTAANAATIDRIDGCDLRVIARPRPASQPPSLRTWVSGGVHLHWSFETPYWHRVLVSQQTPRWRWRWPGWTADGRPEVAKDVSGRVDEWREHLRKLTTES
jgi:hypothetical protein